MWLIVGLGNPGQKYQRTRHNIGFMFLDHWKDKLLPQGQQVSKKEAQSQTYHVKIKGQSVILCQPLTYMNLSGFAVQPLMQFYKIPLTHLLVIHDEMDLPFGSLKFHKNRGSASHNGVQHIHNQLGSKNYMRVRVGIGKVQATMGKGHVLSHFSQEEQKHLTALMDWMREGIEGLFDKGFEKVANEYNGAFLMNAT